MEVTNVTELKKQSKQILDDIANNNKIYLIQRKVTDPIVMLSFSAYNRIQEKLKKLPPET